MELHTLKSNDGARKDKHRVGRGHAAGKGKQAGKGQSGQNKRKGHRPGFEGGQNPWFRRLPKRGFNNINHIEYQVVSLSDINEFFKNGDVVDSEKLHALKLARKTSMPIKLLSNGTIDKKVTVKVNAASKSAIEAIEKAGGKVEVI